MQILSSVSISSQIRAAAVGPAGDLVAIADGEGQILLLDGTDLKRLDAIAIPPGLHDLPPATKLLVCETHLAFFDERLLLIARVEHLSFPDEDRSLQPRFRTRLLALDVRTAHLVGEFETDGSACRLAPTPIPPQHLLLSHEGRELTCVDTRSWHEAGRVGESSPDHDPASPVDEELAPRGVAWHPRRGVLHLLWSSPNGGTVQSYAFDPVRARFTTLRRHLPVSATDAVLEAGGLCLSPDGSQVAAWFPVIDATLPRDASQQSGVPLRARIGRLAIYAGGTIRFLDVESDVSRDLCVVPGPIGHGYSEPGIRIGVDYDNFQPAFLDEDTLLLNTPGGLLLAIHTRTGTTTCLHDFGTPLLAFDLDRPRRRLVACEEEGMVVVASL